MPRHRPSRRWYQFSLRALLVLTTLAALAGWRWRAFEEQLAAEHAFAEELFVTTQGLANYICEEVWPTWITRILQPVASTSLLRVTDLELMPPNVYRYSDTGEPKYGPRLEISVLGKFPYLHTIRAQAYPFDARDLNRLPGLKSLQLFNTDPALVNQIRAALPNIEVESYDL